MQRAKEICCSVDVWDVLLNIILQDAPFFVFRLLLITYYKIISYMNIFFTCKNTLVITLQFYRLMLVQLEKREALAKEAKMLERRTKAQPRRITTRRRSWPGSIGLPEQVFTSTTPIKFQTSTAASASPTYSAAAAAANRKKIHS